MPSTPAALRVTDASRHFGGLKALKSVSLDLHPGERVSVIGTNGAGKSTLFNLVAGTFRPTTGTVELFGENVTRLSADARARQGLARTFQTSQLFDQLTAAENVYIALGGNEFRRGRLRPARFETARWEAAGRMLDRLGLGGSVDAVVGDLSHGEQRQLEIAMALALRPRLLMLDEPAAGFSPAERAALVTLLRELPQAITLLLIEHDMDIALAVASRVVVMHDGEKILEGTPAEIRASQRVREIYLGGTADVA